MAGALLVFGLLLVAALPASADPPVVDSFEFTFDDVNPCTGLTHTVTITLKVFQHHHHGERFVERGETTITTTPTGFSGGGTHTLVDNGQTIVFRSTDMVANETGARIRVRIVFLLDLSTGTVRVDKGEFTCVRA